MNRPRGAMLVFWLLPVLWCCGSCAGPDTDTGHPSDVKADVVPDAIVEILPDTSPEIVPIDLTGYSEYEVVNLDTSLWCRPKYCPPGESTPNGLPCPPIYICIDPETGEEYSDCKLFDDGPSMVCPVKRGPAEIEVPDCVPAEGAVCCNPQTGGCSDDSWAILRCKPDGSGWETEDCVDVDGEKTPCLLGIDPETGEDIAYCSACPPGKTTCHDEVTIHICNFWGLDWELFATCPEDTKCLWGACE